MRHLIRFAGLAAATSSLLIALPSAANADDHLANAATSSGTEERGFTNPVALNPSGTSGGASQPATVPGLGDPKAGENEGTPAFNDDALCDRVGTRSEGSPAACE